MLRFLLTLTTLVISSQAIANPISFATSVNEKLSAVRTPIDFFVVNSAGQRDTGLEQLYKTDSSSIYRGYTFTPKNAVVEVTEMSDTKISLSIGYQTNSVFKSDGAVAGFDFESAFDAKVECVFTSAFVWNCHFLEVHQDFAHDRIWPNPIMSHPITTVSRMGPNAGDFQKSVLSLVQTQAETL